MPSERPKGTGYQSSIGKRVPSPCGCKGENQGLLGSRLKHFRTARRIIQVTLVSFAKHGKNMAMSTTLTILGIAGSLRKESYNRAALRVAQKLAPEGMRIESFDLHGIPPYDQDLESPPPERVTQLKTAVRAADGILFVTPEYNYSIPGVLKNAIDWGSRPYGDSAWEGKPVAVMGASPGNLGTARAQYHLRQVFVFLNMFPLNRPEVMIGNADERFDDQGSLTDEDTSERIRKLLLAFANWIRQLQKGRA